MSLPQPLANENGGVSVLIYGVPGAGKTRLIGTAPGTLIIRPPADHTVSVVDRDNVTEWVVPDWSSMLEAFQYVQQGGHKEHSWVWLDSISLFQDYGLQDVLSDAIIRKPQRAVEKGGVMIPEFGPDVGEYGVNMERLSRWVRDMVGLATNGSINFGITAHPFEWWDPVRDENVWAPWIQGRNMSPKICGYMNMVLYLQELRSREGEESQRLLTADAPGHVGKDQFDCLPALKSGRHGIVDPTMAKLEEAIQKSRGGTAAARKKPARRRRAATTKKAGK